MAGVKGNTLIQDSNDSALKNFEAGLSRSIEQANAGLGKTFKTKSEFLNHLKSLD